MFSYPQTVWLNRIEKSNSAAENEWEAARVLCSTVEFGA